MPLDFSPRFDCFLDDIFGAMLDDDSARGAAVVPLVLEILGRPNSTSESLPRDVILSIKKFLAEARPSETKIVLGWLLDTRRMLLQLPPDKFSTWLAELHAIRKSPTASRQQMDQLLGRLNHSVIAIPLGRHFLGRLYKAQQRAQHHGTVKFTEEQKADLCLWESFLKQAAAGVSLNQLVYRPPNRVIRVDACPWGVGGYTLTSGLAWRWQLPSDLMRRISLNALEFLAIYLGIWMESRFGAPLSDHEVFLSQGDSTSAAGWMHRSNFADDDPFLLIISPSHC
jgi:hypothetical protein